MVCEVTDGKRASGVLASHNLGSEWLAKAPRYDKRSIRCMKASSAYIIMRLKAGDANKELAMVRADSVARWPGEVTATGLVHHEQRLPKRIAGEPIDLQRKSNC